MERGAKQVHSDAPNPAVTCARMGCGRVAACVRSARTPCSTLAHPCPRLRGGGGRAAPPAVGSTVNGGCKSAQCDAPPRQEPAQQLVRPGRPEHQCGSPFGRHPRRRRCPCSPDGSLTRDPKLGGVGCLGVIKGRSGGRGASPACEGQSQGWPQRRTPGACRRTAAWAMRASLQAWGGAPMRSLRAEGGQRARPLSSCGSRLQCARAPPPALTRCTRVWGRRSVCAALQASSGFSAL